MRIAVDTNVLVRYLVWDDIDQAEEATRVIESATHVVISTVVLCELVWVLRRHYRYSRTETAKVINGLSRSRAVELDRGAVAAGLDTLAKGADFADGVIQFEISARRCDTLVTFDHDFAAAKPGSTTLLGKG
jgi:predicted nucleic-acid-binding protein